MQVFHKKVLKKNIICFRYIMVITGNIYTFSHTTKVIQKNETTKYFSIYFLQLMKKKLLKNLDNSKKHATFVV